MIRTRDLVLYVVILLFILTGISVTVWSDLSARAVQTVLVPTAEAPAPGEVSVIVPQHEIDREANLRAMREKLARGESIAMPEPELAMETQDSAEEDARDEVTATSTEAYPMLCAQYSTIEPQWPVSDVEVVEREGARLLVQQTTKLVNINASTTVSTTSEEVIVQLPVPVRASQPSCIDNLVIGVAFDGLPLRNNEASSFAIFGAGTLVGYARDGFPIYAPDPTLQPDECGGVVTASGYQYVLSIDREYILGCFSGTPVAL